MDRLPEATTRGGDPLDVDTELTGALRAGPFSRALDLGIRRHRMSLESVQSRLAERGVHVGLSTLSYWRRGLRHPETERSVRVLGALEDVLMLRSGALVALAMTGGHRPHRRSAGPVGLDTAIGLTPDRIAMLSGIDLDVNLKLTVLSACYTTLVDAERAERALRVSVTAGCHVDGADRFVCMYQTRSVTATLPVMHAILGCRLGRVRTERDQGLVVSELRLDHPLRPGETASFDYEVRMAGEPIRTGCFEHGVRTPCAQLLVRVRFTEPAVPVACYRYFRVGQEPAESAIAELPIGASRTVHALTLDAQPGVHGIRWDWD